MDGGHLLLQPTLPGAVPVLRLLMQTGISGGETTRRRCLCQLSCPLHKTRPPQPSGQDGSACPGEAAFDLGAALSLWGGFLGLSG